MKTQEITSTRTIYIEKCPICKEDVKGFSESILKNNMEQHTGKHKRNKDKLSK